VVSKVPLLQKQLALQAQFNILQTLMHSEVQVTYYNQIAEFKTHTQFLSPSSDTNSSSVTEELPCFYKNREFINVFLCLKHISQTMHRVQLFRILTMVYGNSHDGNSVQAPFQAKTSPTVFRMVVCLLLPGTKQ
jgi:hypothetical protein